MLYETVEYKFSDKNPSLLKHKKNMRYKFVIYCKKIIFSNIQK